MNTELLSKIVATYIHDNKLVIPRKPLELTTWGRREMRECLPNLSKVTAFFGAVIDELRASGNAEESRRVFNAVFDYVASETRKYACDASGYSWKSYASIFDAGSPCCMCDEQSWLSRLASVNGFSDLARYVVSVQCPVSPSGYRREASDWLLCEEGWELRRSHNAELLQKWDGPAFAFLWESSHTR